ncbi:MAG: DUF3489 domain-containing protein [Tabrizicola sp.]|jgi:hypothetical protein|nr:DUF3489 domain-containing protein [Tabrizicola sp.]
MTDFVDMTKVQLSALIGGMTPSQIKKTSHADLVRMAAEASSPTRQPMFASKRTTAQTQQPAKGKPTKVAPKTARKPGADCVLFPPADSQKEPKAGSKRATIIDLLRAAQGTTVDEIAAATAWRRDVAASALYVDVKGSGFGVERRDGRLHLLPHKVK